MQSVDASPSLQALVPTGNRGIQVAIGKIEIPVGVLNIVDEITKSQFEIGEPDVRVDPRDEHSAENARRGRGGQPAGCDSV